MQVSSLGLQHASAPQGLAHSVQLQGQVGKRHNKTGFRGNVLVGEALRRFSRARTGGEGAVDDAGGSSCHVGGGGDGGGVGEGDFC